MDAMILPRVISLDMTDVPLEHVERSAPQPLRREVMLQVRACGVCHTELDEIEGRTAPPRLPIILGHQVVGTVVSQGAETHRFRLGDRAGVGWIHSSTGSHDENLSSEFVATGRDVDGGYAEFMTVPEQYAYPIPDIFSDVEAAPLLCAGGIGYRSLRLTGLEDGDNLGLTGFGASAHLVLPLAKHLFPSSRVFVFARDAEQRDFAIWLGADWAGDTVEAPPEPLHAIIDTTPAWKPVVNALAALRPGGRLVINAIRKEPGDIESLLNLDYPSHLWMEKEIKTVANITHYDLEEFLPIAAEIPLRPKVTTFPLRRANEALAALRQGGSVGAIVLTIDRKATGSL